MNSLADLSADRTAIIDTSLERVDTSAPASGDAPVGRLLLATDLSSVSAQATDRAIELARRHGAELIVLTVADPGRLRLPGGKFLRRIDQERSRLEAGAQELVARARAAGARATFLVWEGDPAESILEAADSEMAEMIILGSHGRGVIGRLVLGSISARVSEAARCRVLIVGAKAPEA
jgi:nucleotide-binding universal stress UspA family protein